MRHYLAILKDFLEEYGSLFIMLFGVILVLGGAFTVDDGRSIALVVSGCVIWVVALLLGDR